MRELPPKGSTWESGDPRDNGRKVVVEIRNGDFVYVRNPVTNRQSRIHGSRFDDRQWRRVR